MATSTTTPLALAIGCLVVLAPPALAGKPTADLRLRYETGRTYDVRMETRTTKTLRGKKRGDTMVLSSQRVFSQGGTWGKDTLVWSEKVTRFEMRDGTLNFDSARDTKVTQDSAPFLVLAGLSFDAKVTPAGEITISNVKRDASPLRKAGYDEDLIKMLLARTSAEALKKELERGLSALPNRTVRLGERFVHKAPAPFASTAKFSDVSFAYKVKSIANNTAKLSYAVKLPKAIGPVKVSKAKVSGTLTFDTAKGIPKEMATKASMRITAFGQKVGLKVAITVSQKLREAKAP